MGTPVVVAVCSGYTEIARLLVEHGARTDVKTDRGESLLWLAAARGQPELVRLFAAQSLDVNARDRNGVTALAAASRARDPERFLLELGAESGSVLLSVAQGGFTDGARALLDHGADVNLLDGSGRTPLILAAEAGHTEVVRLLVETSANVDATDRTGTTALIWTVFRGHTEVVRLLADLGADTAIRDQDGTTALELARRMGHSEAAAILEEREEDRQSLPI